MSRDADLGLGDLAYAVDALEPRDERTLALIAALVGLQTTTRSRASSSQPALPTIAQSEPSAQHADLADAQPPEASTPGFDISLPRLTPVGTDPRSLVTPWRAEEPLEQFDATRHLHPPGPRPPLFDPRWARELLVALLGTETSDGSLDEDAAVDRVARALPLDPIPSRIRRSLRRGAQVLVDVGEGMEPFADDAWDLAQSIERLGGSGNVITLPFWDSPLRGTGPELRPYQPPHAKCPVVVLTDIGIGGPPLRVDSSKPHEWLEMAALLAARGSALVILVPYHHARWPSSLRQRLTLVEWDRTTTAARAHALPKSDTMPPRR